jgi:outer membrane lipoprotein-sorting protein
MDVSRTLILPLLLSTCLAAGAAAAQTEQAQKPSSNPSSLSATAAQTIEDVSKWTRKQWNAAEAKWAQEKDRWNSCQGQAKAQNLVGRRSWQFLYDCMTKG